MQCIRPIWLNDYDIHVPCGSCSGCRISKSREWAIRLCHELNYHDKASFLTLTYEKEPEDEYETYKRHIQLFCKRIRKVVNRFKYYHCFEYGSETWRPHHHMIAFGFGLGDVKNTFVREDTYRINEWPYGDVGFGSVTYQSARYVANYFKKGLSSDRIRGNVKPFQLMSKGLGLPFFIDNAESIYKKGGITINGKNVGIPRYYWKKFKDILYEEEFDNVKRRVSESADEFKITEELRIIDKLEKNEGVYERVLKERRQRDQNIRKREILRSSR